jgi:hypothetical protein
MRMDTSKEWLRLIFMVPRAPNSILSRRTVRLLLVCGHFRGCRRRETREVRGAQDEGEPRGACLPTVRAPNCEGCCNHGHEPGARDQRRHRGVAGGRRAPRRLVVLAAAESGFRLAN